jgi:hypothetical protein
MYLSASKRYVKIVIIIYQKTTGLSRKKHCLDLLQSKQGFTTAGDGIVSFYVIILVILYLHTY